MSYPYHKSNHAEEAISFLPTQFQNADNLQKIIEVAMEQVQELENVFADMYFLTMLEQAEGNQLDMLGAIAGEPRNGTSDDIYRILVKSRIIANRSSGCADTLLDLVKVQSDGAMVDCYELPGIIYIYVTNTIPIPDIFLATVKRVAAAGVNVVVSYSENLPFTLVDVNGPDLPGGGMVDLNTMEGDGYLTSLLS